jgi:hypothetical protein
VELPSWAVIGLAGHTSSLSGNQPQLSGVGLATNQTGVSLSNPMSATPTLSIARPSSVPPVAPLPSVMPVAPLLSVTPAALLLSVTPAASLLSALSVAPVAPAPSPANLVANSPFSPLVIHSVQANLASLDNLPSDPVLDEIPAMLTDWIVPDATYVLDDDWD